MGQQQLLLLVLSTVIVGLATVAGIQAFSEGQEQATQDALTQRALKIGNDVYSALQTPSQLGGVSLSDSPSKISTSAGYNGDTDGISADGAGESADCQIAGGSGSDVTINCADDGANSNGTGNEYVQVTVDTNGASVTNINGQSVGS